MASEGAVPPAVSNASSVARAPTSSSRPAADMDARAPSDGASPSSATASTAPSQPQPQPHPAPTGRKQSEALGPATESPISPPAATGPALSITLMLITGARHPYKIDEKYLTARDTVARAPDGSFDPRQISGYKLKELIWTDWRGEWEPRPAAPSSIRLINMGQMVDDKKTLNDYKFSLQSTNVVHMTVKPADFCDDEETAGAKVGKTASIRQRDAGDGGAGCRCVIL